MIGGGAETQTALDDLLRAAVDRLTAAQVPSPRADAELLLAHVLDEGRGRAVALALVGSPVDEATAARYESLVDERTRRVPLQHLTGLAPFRGLELRVGPGVFIPRPETEQVAQAVLDHLRSQPTASPRVIDLGTGSGALAASIAAEHPSAEVHAVELSDQAAAWAEENLTPHGVTLHRRDLRRLPEEWQASFDVVVSNPPYIPPHMVPTEIEVREHDPGLALYGGGADGLEMPLAVVEAAASLLIDGGWMIMEHAEAQARAIADRLLSDRRFAQVRTHQDLTGRDRATSALRLRRADQDLDRGRGDAARPDTARGHRPSSGTSMGE
ncbi:peptide chain release factor N(5)-glutamine methyltransferase [Nesterenkonia xinjiangensis]|uniref:Release factor glutamine methyltransferase n=1 Tax=Nesterenkonia xinjiangensis TaxID=225327 RepID=A0A7Z0K8H1_9MICC|nr:peptide chain release factor N(5)-glutamine methyltransferase [Nesterenkonia xinjiangensis]NYJ76668.1 release factor glutamine methyltransferase [Nesterenkonia xinjiangensis]